MESTVSLNYIQANYDTYPAAVEAQRAAYLEFPRNVSIETQVKCNAKCNFCPYPTSPRRGEEMQTELFERLIESLSRIPATHRFGINLSRINEPLLDKRLQAFSQLVADKLPSAAQQFWSNGTMLKEGAFEWMNDYRGASLTISLNSMNEEEHVRLMGLGLEVVLRNLDYTHRLAEAGRFDIPVTLCAPFHGAASSRSYQQAVAERWPLFVPVVRPFFEWMGESHAGGEQRVAFGFPSPAAHRATEFACAQWFDLHVLANGYVTKCCIDETGHQGDPDFDTAVHDVLDLYQRTVARLGHLPPRSRVKGCEGCRHLG